MKKVYQEEDQGEQTVLHKTERVTVKPYKLKRKQQQDQMNSIRKTNRSNLLKLTKKIALENFQEGYSGSVGDAFGVERFGYRLYLKMDYQLLVDDYTEKKYFKIYENFMGKLKRNKEKADYLKQNYTPLESDLFIL